MLIRDASNSADVLFATPLLEQPSTAANRLLADVINETFQATTFPPTGWTRFKTDTQTSTSPDWVRVTSARTAP